MILADLIGPVVYRREITELAGLFLADYSVERLYVELTEEEAERYRAALADVPSVELPPAAPPGGLHGYHLFVIRHAERRRLYDALRAEGILAQVHYLPVYWHPYYMDRYGFREGLCPEAEAYYRSCLSLPCFPGLGEDDQQRVIDAVRRLA